MTKISERLDKQDKQLQEIIWILKGSTGLGIEGVMPAIKRIEHDVAEMKDWRKELTNNRWKLDLKGTARVIGSIIGVIGVIFGIFEAMRQVFAP